MNHSKELLMIEHDPETFSPDDVEVVVARGEDRGDVNGVHYVTLFQTLRDHDIHAAKVVQAIQECLQDGTIYEVRENVFRLA